MTVRLGSLFSGIGGLELGIERAIPGARTVWQVEQNPYARAVLEKHWPNARRYEDVRQVGAHNLEPVDILIGGFPCQDTSQGGRGAGIDGERSGLWSEFARIIRELTPLGLRVVVVENVANLLANGMGRVVGDLAKSGYDCVWDCIPAEAVGAHHTRDRVFIVAHTTRQSDPTMRGECAAIARQGLSRSTIGRGREGNVRWETSIRGTGHTAGAFCESLKHATDWDPEPRLGRVATGVPYRVDRLRCLGNSVVPQVGQVVGRVVSTLIPDLTRWGDR